VYKLSIVLRLFIFRGKYKEINVAIKTITVTKLTENAWVQTILYVLNVLERIYERGWLAKIIPSSEYRAVDWIVN